MDNFVRDALNPGRGLSVYRQDDGYCYVQVKVSNGTITLFFEPEATEQLADLFRGEAIPGSEKVTREVGLNGGLDILLGE